MKGFGEATDQNNLEATTETQHTFQMCFQDEQNLIQKYFQHFISSKSREILRNIPCFQLFSRGGHIISPLVLNAQAKEHEELDEKAVGRLLH